MPYFDEEYPSTNATPLDTTLATEPVTTPAYDASAIDTPLESARADREIYSDTTDLEPDTPLSEDRVPVDEAPLDEVGMKEMKEEPEATEPYGSSEDLPSRKDETTLESNEDEEDLDPVIHNSEIDDLSGERSLDPLDDGSASLRDDIEDELPPSITEKLDDLVERAVDIKSDIKEREEPGEYAEVDSGDGAEDFTPSSVFSEADKVFNSDELTADMRGGAGMLSPSRTSFY
jgi:hypothetical protein